jgi:hypothetical protein
MLGNGGVVIQLVGQHQDLVHQAVVQQVGVPCNGLKSQLRAMGAVSLPARHERTCMLLPNCLLAEDLPHIRKQIQQAQLFEHVLVARVECCQSNAL